MAAIARQRETEYALAPRPSTMPVRSKRRVVCIYVISYIYVISLARARGAGRRGDSRVCLDSLGCARAPGGE